MSYVSVLEGKIFIHRFQNKFNFIFLICIVYVSKVQSLKYQNTLQPMNNINKCHSFVEHTNHNIMNINTKR